MMYLKLETFRKPVNATPISISKSFCKRVFIKTQTLSSIDKNTSKNLNKLSAILNPKLETSLAGFEELLNSPERVSRKRAGTKSDRTGPVKYYDQSLIMPQEQTQRSAGGLHSAIVPQRFPAG